VFTCVCQGGRVRVALPWWCFWGVDPMRPFSRISGSLSYGRLQPRIVLHPSIIWCAHLQMAAVEQAEFARVLSVNRAKEAEDAAAAAAAEATQVGEGTKRDGGRAC
jgi:hypothetical protein